MPGYSDLRVWHRAALLNKLVRDLTELFPIGDRIAYADQMKRAAFSIVSNIAEGSRRFFKNEKRQYYRYAFASAAELESQLSTLVSLNIIPKERFKQAQSVNQEVLRLMNRLVMRFR